MSTQRSTAETSEPITSGTRSTLVDIVKGIAIILVVFGHTLQGAIHRGWGTGSRVFFTDDFIYSFHMPAFFFVAGLFVIGSIRKRGPAHFTVDKVKTILYPYALWGTVFAVLSPFLVYFAATPRPFLWKVFLVGLLEGNEGWFLYTLFFCLLLAMLTVRLPHWLRFVSALIISLCVPFSTLIPYEILREFCFLAAGMWVGNTIFRLERLQKARAALGLILFLAIQFLAIRLYGPPGRWSFVALGLTGTCLLFFAARVLEKHQLGNALAWIGRASLAVFLMSAFGQITTRAILLKVFHTNNLWLQLLLPTAFATLLPAIVWYQQDRWRLGWLFRWPL
ncbi:acyltransferase family protein [Granulicella sp. S190]|uniref:acyltransferase family protein n=1 Tax=Granulicella sp. S190 TaxID=1747226 RepID=UPI00131CD4AA|nr:acyltransferase family protein [Granulicella sp. S190]